jgi:hypothetical protein
MTEHIIWFVHIAMPTALDCFTAFAMTKCVIVIANAGSNPGGYAGLLRTSQR